MSTLTRSIKFYRLHISGAYLSQAEARTIFLNLETALNALPVINRYYYPNEDHRIYASEIDYESTPIKLIFGKTQTRMLPSKEKKLRFTPIPLQDDQDQLDGITYKSHAVVFSDGVIGLETYQNAPTSQQISSFITEITGTPVGLFPLINSEFAGKLANLSEITMLKIQASSALLSDMRTSNDSLLSSIGGINTAGAEEIEIVLKVNGRGLGQLTGVQRAVQFLERFRSGAHLQGMQVKGRDRDSDKLEMIDLMSSAIVSHQTMVTINEKSRDIKRESAFSAIADAHTYNAGEIESAINGGIIEND